MLVKTPLNTGEVKLSAGSTDLYWKQILPRKKIDYHGRILDFENPQYHKNIVAAFKANALGEQTAFQLADDENSHRNAEDIAKNRNFDPERYRGEIVDIEAREDGTWVQLKPNAEGNKTISGNPKLGVSAMLEEGYKSHDGKVYPVVLRHVLGTINPHIKGMGNWEKAEISLSSSEDANQEVIDLTSTETKPENTKVDDKNTEIKPDDKPSDSVTVPKEQWDEMQSYFKTLKEEDAALESLMAEEDDDEDDDDEPVTLSAKDQARFTKLENKYAASEFDRKADQWRREGVPNQMIELARPAMSVADSGVITLSSGETKDPREIIAAILDEAKGTIDLSEQKSHTQQLSEDDNADLNTFVSAVTGYNSENGEGNYF